MTPDQIAAMFDQRAAGYHHNDWHRRSAERLVALCAARGLRGPLDVLDAGTGTGFATFAAARQGARVRAVDLSAGMLAQAQAAVPGELAARVVFERADATALTALADASFDWVLCATALHMMPVARALAEWRRLLRPAGRVAFSTVAAGTPRAGALFREIAAEFGVRLDDPSGSLGIAAACRALLAGAGFERTEIVEEEIEFSPLDRSVAWESNLRSAGHAAVCTLHAEALTRMRERYERALDAGVAADAASFARIRVLYALSFRGA